MVIWFFRGLFIIAGTAVAYNIAPEGEDHYSYMLVGLALSGLIVLAEWFFSRSPIWRITSVVFGSIVGILLAVVARAVVELAFPIANPQTQRALFLGLSVVFVYVSIAFLYQTRDKFRMFIPYVEFRREERGARPVLLDTSVIVDGRITDVLHTGVLDGPIIIPQMVTRELHHIADSEDKLKRERGRLGLRMLGQLREDPKLDVRFERTDTDPRRPVDEQLLEAAKKTNARIMTSDFNLNRLATLEGIEILNINELANALKPVALPDETIAVKLIKRGEQPGQAVGYLEDGTMVVVEDATHMLGAEAQILVTNTITRDTGRMIFGRLEGTEPNDTPSTRHKRYR